MKYYFDVNFKTDALFRGSIEADKNSTVKEVVELCKNELRLNAKWWEESLEDLSMFIVYYLIGKEAYEIFGWDLTIEKK